VHPHPALSRSLCRRQAVLPALLRYVVTLDVWPLSLEVGAYCSTPVVISITVESKQVYFGGPYWYLNPC